MTEFGSKNLRIISDVNLSVNEAVLKNKGFSLYPNPSEGFLNVKIESLTGSSNYTITSYNFLGKIVFNEDQITAPYFSENIDTRAWSSGTYLVKIVSEDGFSDSRKFVKK